jgi:tRNA G37 N-methylase TrmD
MEIEIVTIFPEFFSGPLEHGTAAKEAMTLRAITKAE